jgi:glyoxylase-like metal-dependent hydrolase (beta-lactamase superfamily II)
VDTPYTCLLLKTGHHKVLIDTGADGLAPTTGNLLKNLQAAGTSPNEITDVVLTHGHPDHIGGVLEPSGQPAFPNARYLMSTTEWNFWNDSSALHDAVMDHHMKQMLVGCAQKHLPPLKGQIELFDGEKEIVPGIQAIPAPGHTPGHSALLVSSSEAQLLHLSDAVLHPLHLENPGWRNVFDLDPERTANTRRELRISRGLRTGLGTAAVTMRDETDAVQIDSQWTEQKRPGWMFLTLNVCIGIMLIVDRGAALGQSDEGVGVNIVWPPLRETGTPDPCRILGSGYV